MILNHLYIFKYPNSLSLIYKSFCFFRMVGINCVDCKMQVMSSLSAIDSYSFCFDRVHVIEFFCVSISCLVVVLSSKEVSGSESENQELE